MTCARVNFARRFKNRQRRKRSVSFLLVYGTGILERCHVVVSFSPHALQRHTNKVIQTLLEHRRVVVKMNIESCPT
ncbi:hypothetical protein M406DRAFT_320676 [Cryphonectria parasitica EP155]|uniref:Uncharacterized protein n=1 Tax=Cryphonectria parasitica (strain ATCC 38755 / EP155) TaxID=660469 RepID=A0A9P4YD72_CRYP1|nr:uncharacterized protein M406DRAFT_320676 [Cryphonectria parasitica EP155]KAF3771208.1 hypothetical protein M406DRAFT_320676 [Cryphonectria parasitica EP155]